MKFGGDFFKIVEFIVLVLKMFGRIFGDKEDNDEADKVENNHSAHVKKWLGDRYGSHR